MRILFSIHLYPPKHLCGAEFYAHNIAKELVKRGHQVRVYLHQWYGASTDGRYSLDGVDVCPPTCSNQAKEELFQWADIVLTHLDFTKWTLWKCRQLGKPCVFITHNTSNFYDQMVKDASRLGIIYNAQHAKDFLNYDKPSIVLPPHMDLERVKCDRVGDYITLINLNENKGVKQFYKIAEAMPERRFLGVIGSYMEQDTNCPPNVTIWPKQVDIRKVYEQTRILLMPSDYESYGMTASEAMANGIPVICTPTPGLKENCGDAAQYLPRDNTKKWVSLIRKLDDPKEYKKWSDLSQQRTKDRPDKISELETFLQSL